ncbi:protein NUCLEAR FUSION DEFECTIVE 4-like [Senna tora]|uniref:Protein NUCLEAR FUSION DEFECTIVE 4-like n=1 Tax=Senna tora TaxID=362788 RepID=A0A834TYS3_9FABA|nr:protein NUCLEAR FUSION DEFECTIVE 4-like [Senna tora]
MRPRKDADKRKFISDPEQPFSSSLSSSSPPRRIHRLRRLLIKLLQCVAMAGQSRKWMLLVATIWLQAFTGTNFDFSDYSSALKSALNISQVQLNYLATASDLGKVFGWSSGLALMYFPLSVVMFMAAFMGFFGYGLQWLLLRNFITLPYCLNFPVNRPLALSLTVSYNGVSAALYTLAANSIDPSSSELYLLLNALVPLITSLAALIPILRQPAVDPLPPDALHRDSMIFLILNFFAVLTGLYLLLFSSSSSDATTTRLYFGGAIFLLIFPLCIPGIIYARDWFYRFIHSSFRMEGSSFLLVHVEDLELHRDLLTRPDSPHSLSNGDSESLLSEKGSVYGNLNAKESDGCCTTMIDRDQLAILGQEHPASLAVRSNNMGQIAQSLGLGSNVSTIVTLYSSFSFFGRLLSAGPDYIRTKFYFARTGWLTIGLLPTPIAFFLLAASDSAGAVYTGSALIGLSSGFIFAAAVSITSELFGPNSVGVNHNILITNIPIGSLLYGFLAAVIYEANGHRSSNLTNSVMCMGRQCYFWTFVMWGCLSVIGLASSVLLFLRTKHAYDNFETRRISTQTILS